MGAFEGYSLDVDKYLNVLLAASRFRPRDVLEHDSRYKQLIPYVVLRHRERLFRYVRGASSREARLSAHASIGIGGHIEIGDEGLFAQGREAYSMAMRREVDEEVAVTSPFVDRIAGLINVSTDEVSRVHFGVVHLWDLAEPMVQKRERKITEARFARVDQLIAGTKALESWSRIALGIISDARTARWIDPRAGPNVCS